MLQLREYLLYIQRCISVVNLSTNPKEAGAKIPAPRCTESNNAFPSCSLFFVNNSGKIARKLGSAKQLNSVIPTASIIKI